MNIYITGGTGFIGSYVVKELAGRGNNITVLARNPRKSRGLSSLPGVSVKKADMHDYSALKKNMVKPGALIHVALCWGDTGPDMIKNETLNSVKLIELALRRGAKKIIFTSSTAAAGIPEKNISEDDLRKPFDFYGATKGAVELFMSAYSSYYPKIKFNVIRPGYTFGNPVVESAPMQPDARFRDIVKNAKRNKKIELIKNDGTQFLWAGDLAKVYRAVLSSNLNNEIFYGLGRNFVTWEQIAKWAVKYSKSKSKIKLIDKGWADSPNFYVVSKIKKYFGMSFRSTEKIKEHIRYLISSV